MIKVPAGIRTNRMPSLLVKTDWAETVAAADSRMLPMRKMENNSGTDFEFIEYS